MIFFYFVAVLVPLAFILAIIVAIIAILIVCKFHQKKGDPSFMKQYSQGKTDISLITTDITKLAGTSLCH